MCPDGAGCGRQCHLEPPASTDSAHARLTGRTSVKTGGEKGTERRARGRGLRKREGSVRGERGRLTVATDLLRVEGADRPGGPTGAASTSQPAAREAGAKAWERRVPRAAAMSGMRAR
eukprot:scaffold2501_cov113-Isochrysis_galbana.AAC.4